VSQTIEESFLKIMSANEFLKSTFTCVSYDQKPKVLFSPLGKPADRAIYFVCINFFFFFTMSKAISVSTGPIFTILPSNGRYLREFSRSSPVFLIPQGTLPWQPILICTGLVRSEPKYLRIRWTNFHNLCTIW